jgi:hypothetical protein
MWPHKAFGVSSVLVGAAQHFQETAPMKASLNLMFSLAATLALCFAPLSNASAQDVQLEQVKLTEAQVKGYLAASKPLAEIAEKLEAAGDNPDPKLTAELENIAKQNGFQSYDELDLVISNISFVLSGFDDKGEFTDPHIALKEELEQIKGDKSMKANEKSQAIAEIEEAIKATPPLQHKENVALIKKYLPQLDEVLQGQQ